MRPVHHRRWRMQGQRARGDANVRSDPPPHTTLHSRHDFILCPLKSVGARGAVILVKLKGRESIRIISLFKILYLMFPTLAHYHFGTDFPPCQQPPWLWLRVRGCSVSSLVPKARHMKLSDPNSNQTKDKCSIFNQRTFQPSARFQFHVLHSIWLNKVHCTCPISLSTEGAIL